MKKQQQQQEQQLNPIFVRQRCVRIAKPNFVKDNSLANQQMFICIFISESFQTAEYQSGVSKY